MCALIGILGLFRGVGTFEEEEDKNVEKTRPTAKHATHGRGTNKGRQAQTEQGGPPKGQTPNPHPATHQTQPTGNASRTHTRQRTPGQDEPLSV